MEAQVKEFVNWDAGLDWEKAKPGAISVEFTKDDSFFSDEYTKEQFVDYLQNQRLLWRVLRRIIERKYVAVNNRQFSVDNTNLKDNLLYHEGYKQALRDIHKLIPRPRGE